MSIGIWQVLIVVVLVFLIFGAGRLPRIMEDLAKGITSFKKGMTEEELSSTASEKTEEQKKIEDKTVVKTTSEDKTKEG